LYVKAFSTCCSQDFQALQGKDSSASIEWPWSTLGNPFNLGNSIYEISSRCWRFDFNQVGNQLSYYKAQELSWVNSPWISYSLWIVFIASYFDKYPILDVVVLRVLYCPKQLN